MMTNDDERGGGGKKCPKFDDVICERPLIKYQLVELINLSTVFVLCPKCRKTSPTRSILFLTLAIGFPKLKLIYDSF